MSIFVGGIKLNFMQSSTDIYYALPIVVLQSIYADTYIHVYLPFNNVQLQGYDKTLVKIWLFW